MTLPLEMCIRDRVSVHADAVDVGEFNPPETVLYQVAVNVRILLVEVGDVYKRQSHTWENSG